MAIDRSRSGHGYTRWYRLARADRCGLNGHIPTARRTRDGLLDVRRRDHHVHNSIDDLIRR